MGERTVKTHGRKPMMRIGSSEGVKGSPVAFTSFLNPYRPRMPTAMNIYIFLYHFTFRALSLTSAILGAFFYKPISPMTI